MTNQQVVPEALHLANASNAMADEGEMIHLLSWHDIRNLLRANAAELRRQHARIAELQARIKTMAEEHADELMVAHLDGRSQAAQPAGAQQPTTQPAPQQEAASVDLKTMELAESVGLIGPASRTNDLHAAIQRFHDLICANATIKAAQMAAEAISEAAPQQEAQEPDFWTVCAQYEDGDEAGWVPLPGYSNETEHGVKNLVLQAARKEGYKGTVTGRLQELGWEIRPVYLAPPSSLQQPVPASAAEFAIRALVAAGHVTQERVDQAMALPGAPAQAGAVPLTDREIELIDGMIQVQLDHASRCDAIANRAMADKQKGWDMERVALLQKFKAHGIKGGQHGADI